MEKCGCEHCKWTDLSDLILGHKKRLVLLPVSEQISKILGQIILAKKPFITLDWDPSEECTHVFQNHGLMLQKTEIKSGEHIRWNLEFI